MTTFWPEIAAGFLGNVFAGVLFVILYVVIQWFLQVTDITISYGWSFEGTNFHPNFDLRNRSKSRTYLLANIAYTNGKDAPTWADNTSLWGRELKPGSMNEFREVAPVKNVSSLSECMQLQVTVRLQTGRKFWLKGRGPGQPGELVMGRVKRGRSDYAISWRSWL